MTGSCSTTVADLADRLWRAESDRVAVPPLTATASSPSWVSFALSNRASIFFCTAASSARTGGGRA